MHIDPTKKLADAASTEPESLPAKEVRLAYGPERLQFGALHLPAQPGPSPVVLLIHGGFWRAPYDLSLMSGLAEDLARRGIAVWNIEYRRIGDPGGGWPETLHDVARAADYLYTLSASYPLDLQRVVTAGHSAGGHLALWLAARKTLPPESPLALAGTPLSLRGVVSLAGANDLEHVWRLGLGGNAAAELLGGDPHRRPERYAAASPAAHLPLGLPQVLVHGSADRHVPLIVSQAYAQKARDAGDQVTLLELPGEDHFAVIDPASRAWQITLEEIHKLLA
ncbi:MAG TPA: alpha/beta hydrolase [Ktedonobacteraceae bacterium]